MTKNAVLVSINDPNLYSLPICLSSIGTGAAGACGSVESSPLIRYYRLTQTRIPVTMVQRRSILNPLGLLATLLSFSVRGEVVEITGKVREHLAPTEPVFLFAWVSDAVLITSRLTCWLVGLVISSPGYTRNYIGSCCIAFQSIDEVKVLDLYGKIARDMSESLSNSFLRRVQTSILRAEEQGQRVHRKY